LKEGGRKEGRQGGRGRNEGRKRGRDKGREGGKGKKEKRKRKETVLEDSRCARVIIMYGLSLLAHKIGYIEE
jgi:hypothetical protein